MQNMNCQMDAQPNYMYCACDDQNCGAVCDSCMNDAECYSKASMKYASCILEFIYEEYSDYRYYMKMCEKCRCMENKRIFKAMAEDELRHSNLFVSAYFLITGKRFCPAKNCNTECSCGKSLAESLRERYFEELCGSQQYANYAKGVDDDCLKQLLMEASEDEKEHSMMIMDMIKRICACD